MGRFADAIGFGRNSTYGRAGRGDWTPLVAQTLGNMALPGVGTLLGNWIGNRHDRTDRLNHVPNSPMGDQGNGLMDGLGITDWSGRASPEGAYGPMSDGYAGLPNTPDSQTNTYDPDAAQNIVNGYLPADNTPAYNGPVPVSGSPTSSNAAFGANSGVFDNLGLMSNGIMGAINGYGASSGMASRIAGGAGKRVNRSTQDVSQDFA